MQASETSESRPITVSWILKAPVEDQTDSTAQVPLGQLGLCFCPGKQHVRGGRRLNRNLDTDLARLRDHYHVDCMVCLLNDAELRSYNLRDYSAVLLRHKLEYVQYPIIECAAPDDLLATAELVEQLAGRLEQNQVVAVHCRGGVGRAGLIAACLLLRLGRSASATEAIKEVRRLRCKTAVETRRQEDFVALYARHLLASLVIQA